MKFYEMAPGAVFAFGGRRFTKTAMSMAEDENRCGNIFQSRTEVEPKGVPLLLPLEIAAQWKPDERPWTDYITPAPGQTVRRREL
jgi:hypothetical protein